MTGRKKTKRKRMPTDFGISRVPLVARQPVFGSHETIPCQWRGRRLGLACRCTSIDAPYLVSWDLISVDSKGKTGTDSHRIKWLCREHAIAWARRHRCAARAFFGDDGRAREPADLFGGADGTELAAAIAEPGQVDP